MPRITTSFCWARMIAGKPRPAAAAPSAPIFRISLRLSWLMLSPPLQGAALIPGAGRPDTGQPTPKDRSPPARAYSADSTSLAQGAAEGFGEVSAHQGLAQHLGDAHGARTLGELRAAVAAHQHDRQLRPHPPDLARQLHAAQVRHGLVGEHQIEALRFGA